jgi:hypothetical protein
MSLEKWAKYGCLRRKATSPAEIKDLLRIVERAASPIQRSRWCRPIFDSSLLSTQPPVSRRLRSAPLVIAPQPKQVITLRQSNLSNSR